MSPNKSLSSLPEEARDRECQIRIPGVCNHNSQTVVLCHFRLVGISGLGIKSPHWLGAWGCSACHAICDSCKDDDIQLDFAKGVFRTQYILFQEGRLK